MTSARAIIAASLTALAATHGAGAATPVHEFNFQSNQTDPADHRVPDAVTEALGRRGTQLTYTRQGVPSLLGGAVVGYNPTNLLPQAVVVPRHEIWSPGPGEDFAIAIWFKRTSFPGATEGLADTQEDNAAGWRLFLGADDTIRFRMNDGAGPNTTANSSASITDNDWRHLVVTIDRDQPSGLRFYIDGALDSEHDPTPFPGAITATQDLWIAGLLHNAIPEGLNGQVATFQIFNQNLSATDAALLARGDRVLHQHDLDGDATDPIGGADGVVGANVVFTDAGVPTGLGSAAVFTGDGDVADNRIDVPELLAAAPATSDFSISFWVRRDDASGNAGVYDSLGPGATNGIQIQFLSNNRVRARIDDVDGNQVAIESASGIGAGVWTHLLLSVDRHETDGAKWYIDGVLDSASDPTSVPGVIGDSQDVRLGAVNNLGLEGALARVALYTYALTPEDAQRLMDLDGDRVPLTLEVCTDGDDNDDLDLDLVPDTCDPCIGADNVDSDGDGVCDSLDICPGDDDLADADEDTIPDACDLCFGADNVDADKDGVCDSLDACPGDDAACVMPGNVLCVSSRAPGANDGSNWFNAYRSLQDAIVASAEGDDIWIASGTYFSDGGHKTPAGRFTPGSGSRTQGSFWIQTHRTLLGGFRGNETSADQRDPDANPTILSGDLDNDGSLFRNAHNVMRTSFTTNVLSEATIDGVTITGGFADGPGNSLQNNGAGILMRGGDLTLRRCRLVGNVAEGRGAAITVRTISHFSATLDATDCHFIGNHADSVGGAVALFATTADKGTNQPTGGRITASFERCEFIGNAASSGGAIANVAVNNTAGLSNVLAECSVSNSLFLGNLADDQGGALYNRTTNNTASPHFPEATLRLANATLSQNHAAAPGAGAANSADGCNMCNASTNLQITNTIAWDNTSDTATGEDAQVFSDTSSSTGGAVTLITTVDHSLIQGGWTGDGIENLSTDPLFETLPAPGADGFADDPRTENADEGFNDALGSLRLSAGSPAIDAGNNSAAGSTSTVDLDGAPRFVDDPAAADTGSGGAPLIDLGPYERTPAVCPGDVDGDNDTDVFDFAILADAFGRSAGQSAYDDRADLVDDDTINTFDFAELAEDFGCDP